MLREVTGAEADVRALFNPRSVAILGASARPGALSWWPLRLLRDNGFTGEVYPINPNRAEIEGVPCYASLTELPAPPDVAMVALNAERSLQAVRECAEAGVRAVVMPTQGFGELGADGRAKERELASLAGAGKLRIVGTNTDGIGNLQTGAIASIQPLFGERISPGPVAIATQSGATAGSLMVRLKREGIGCRLYASAGNETDLGFADYLSVMVQDPEVKLVLSFVESIRRPEDFLNVAALAAELGKPLALIKVGRSQQGARRAAAHTGALAGQDAIYEAIFREYGVIRVDELSELVAVAKLFVTQGAPRGRGVGIMSVSGGQAGAVADSVSRAGLAVPVVSDATEAAIDAALEFGTGFNPCDLTGAVATDPTLAATVYRAFDGEDELHTIIYARKALTGDAGTQAAANLADAVGETPLAVYAMDGAITGAEAETYRACDIPVFASVHDLARAIDGLAAWREATPPRPRGDAPLGPLGDGKAALREAGIPLAGEALVHDAEAAVAAAERIGYPVVMKLEDARVAHKTEAGGVLVGVEDAAAGYAQLEAVTQRLFGTAPEAILLQEQVAAGIELILGVKVDPGFGPFVLAGAGGVLTEVLADSVLRPAPVTRETALTMIGELRVSRLLSGYRGAPPADVGALADAIVALSEIAWQRRDSLVEADLNPVIVLPEGVRVVDVLMVER